ncbi:MAG TPA: ribonuclease H-like domain-containing protein [Acidobacteriaceae bacterium]|nr:ribonuclease H-like domain-containing protein [Acidobacteriaceae bacterium]
MSTGPRICVLDIETSPIEAYVWGLWDQNIGLEQIKQDWTIISFCVKWLGEKELVYEDTGGRGVGKVRDDRKLLKQLWQILDDADIVVAQNGRNFDIKKINARLIQHGYTPYSPIKIVDTLEAAKKHFGFTSNKLAYLSSKLARTRKYEHKEFPGFELWKECLADNPKAWAVMRKYNPLDVISTAEVYEAMRPWITSHPNHGVYIQDKELRCPKCGSKSLQRRGYSATMLNTYPRFQCQDCHGWLRGKQTELPRDIRKALLTNIV